MTTCETVDISAVIDGAADEETLRHLSDCTACRDDEALLRQARDELSQLPAPPIPADFDARVMTAVRASLQTPGWRARVEAWRDSLLDLLLGPVNPAPLTARSIVGACVASGAAFGASAYLVADHVLSLGTSCLQTTAVHGRGLPFEPWVGPHSPYAVIVGMLLLCVAAASLLRVAGGRALLSSTPLPVGTAARLGLFALVSYVSLASAAVFVYTFFLPYVHPSLQGFEVSAWWLFTAGLWVGCVWVGRRVVEGRMHRIGLTAGTFYLALLLGWGGGLLLQSAFFAGFNREWAWAGGVGQAAPQAWIAALTFGVAPMFGAGLALFGAAVTTRSAPRATRRVVTVVLALILVAIGAFATYGAVQAAPFIAGDDSVLQVEGRARQRTVVVVSSRDPHIGEYDLPARLSDENLGWLGETAAHSGGRLGARALSALVQAYALRWDSASMWRCFDAYLSHPGGSSRALFFAVGALREAGATTENIEHLQQLLDRPDVVVVDEEFARVFVSRTLQRMGAPTGRWASGETVTAAVSMHTGSLRGRLVMDGRPLADVPVRLFPGHVPSYTSDGRGIESQPWASLNIERTRSTQAESIIHPMTVTRTDADGRFRFTGLPDDTYSLGLLFDGSWHDVRGRVSATRLAKPAEVTPGNPQIDVGDVVIRGER